MLFPGMGIMTATASICVPGAAARYTTAPGDASTATPAMRAGLVYPT